MRKLPSFGKACFNCGKLNHYEEFCKKIKQATLNSLLTTLKKSSFVLCNADILKPSLINVAINGVHLNELLATGASDYFMMTNLKSGWG